MPRGRKPSPTVLNNLRGDPGKKRRHLTEPTLPPAIPDCPPSVLKDDYAKEEWDSITQILSELGVLTTADQNALAVYCKTWSRWRRATEHIDQEGEVMISPKSGFPMKSTWLIVADKAQDQLHKMLAEFGLTPSARARLATRPDSSKASVPDKWKGKIA